MSHASYVASHVVCHMLCNIHKCSIMIQLKLALKGQCVVYEAFKRNVINVIFEHQKNFLDTKNITQQRNHTIHRKNCVCSEYNMLRGCPRMGNEEYIHTYYEWKEIVPFISRAGVNFHVT